jgi:hypothetical protein
MTNFEWDEEKRLRTLRDRALDFLRARVLFDGRHVLTRPARSAVEERRLTIGEIDGKIYCVVWTPRGEARRIISFRRARAEEERAYRQLHG